MASPLGIGVGDFVIVGKAARELCRRLRESPGEYQQLAAEAKQFSELLETFRDLVTRVKLTGPQFAQLVEREKDSQKLLNQIHETLDRYQSLGGEDATAFKKLKWRKDWADDLRSQVTNHVTVLNSFYTSVGLYAILDALPWIKLSMQAGKTPCPSVASLSQASAYEDDDAAESDWAEITGELETLGITAQMAKAHRHTIVRYFETAVSQGELPYRADSGSWYSGPVSGYSEVVRQVESWMETRIQAGSLGESGEIFETTSIRTIISSAKSLAPYTCIICLDGLSSKGVCKRHLQVQHVSPKIYKCERCGARFDLKRDAKAHSNACGQGVFLYTTRNGKEREVYACEFTGLCFDSPWKYVEHLLMMCENPVDRPKPDLHRKLRGLLSRPCLIDVVTEASTVVLGCSTVWEYLHWTNAKLVSAIEALENARVHDSGTLEFTLWSQSRYQDTMACVVQLFNSSLLAC